MSTLISFNTWSDKALNMLFITFSSLSKLKLSGKAFKVFIPVKADSILALHNICELKTVI